MINVSAVIQVAILYAVIYAILKAAKGSRFGQVLAGVGLVAAAMFLFTYVFHFDVLTTIVRTLLAYLAISTVVIFQPEIRRILSQLGTFGTSDRPKYSAGGAADPGYVTDVLLALAERRIGALVAFERGISLRGYEETGVATDALFSRELVETIFTPPLPLHDGGITVRDGRIAAAHCVFPVSNNPNLSGSGMRHRAAVGLSEDTDAIVVAVSEENGVVSVAHNGRLLRCTGEGARDSLLRWVAKGLPAAPRRGIMSRIFDRRRGGKKKGAKGK